jgi:adenosylcobinamide kinase / adenosylcobinamide-phosphate guanylyltransferase
MITLVTGGARSGKTRFALASAGVKEPRHYIATAQLLDDEMRQRATNHRIERGEGWTTIEEPFDAADHLRRMRGVVVFDCLTLWLSNWMLRDESQLDHRIQELCAGLRETKADVVAITNEVGCSIVPDNALARRFRDYSGLMNQRVAEISDRVFLMVSGIPIKVK